MRVYANWFVHSQPTPVSTKAARVYPRACVRTTPCATQEVHCQQKAPRAFTTTCVYTQTDLCIHAPLVLHGLCVLMCVLVYVCECVSVCMCALVCLIVCLFVWLFVRVCVRGCACVDVGLLLCACDVRVCVRARPVTSEDV